MDKKEELLINAAKIVYEEGIQKLTMDYLAQKSDITKGGVLYHFENKGNLLLEMNKMAVNKFEQLLHHYLEKLTGTALFTRAYAYATVDYFKNPTTALLPAVFISSLEDETCYQLWEETSKEWDQSFQEDSGDAYNNLKLRLICDGIWFSILYATDDALDEKIETVVLKSCESLEKGND